MGCHTGTGRSSNYFLVRMATMAAKEAHIFYQERDCLETKFTINASALFEASRAGLGISQAAYLRVRDPGLEPVALWCYDTN